jgi:tRNA(Ile)-lysidine synthase
MTASPISLSEASELFAPLERLPRVALAVSGGPDSLALMHLAAWWQAAGTSRPALSVLTVDHGLRASSRDEALMVGRMASALGLSHATLTWEKSGERSTNLQARARAARYDLMAAYCQANDIPALVTAHHLDDQAETFLMRLRRGSGLDGLAAIPERGAWAGIILLRPLLDVPKARLVATLVEQGISFASDPSNFDRRFERARVRGSAEALAALGLTPEALALSARRLRRAREALDAAAQDFLAANSEMSEAGYAVIDRDALGSVPQEIALRALARLIAAVGGTEDSLRLAKLEALLAVLVENPSKAHTLGRCRIQPFSGRLGIFREVRRQGLPVVGLRPGERTLWDNRFKIELSGEETEPVTVRALGEQGLREMRDRDALLASIPRVAGRALPFCWRGDNLISMPLLGGLSASSHEARLDCRATFVSAERVAMRGGTAPPLGR